MFSALSRPGIVLGNARSMAISLMATSLAISVLGLEPVTILLGIMIGSYYGYVLEKQTHEFSMTGGRVMRGRNWDYLVMAAPGA